RATGRRPAGAARASGSAGSGRCAPARPRAAWRRGAARPRPGRWRPGAAPFPRPGAPRPAARRRPGGRPPATDRPRGPPPRPRRARSRRGAGPRPPRPARPPGAGPGRPRRGSTAGCGAGRSPGHSLATDPGHNRRRRAGGGCRIGSLAPMARSSAPGGDLFSAAAEEHLARQAPLAARLRPQRLDDIVGQDELLGPGRPLRVLVESDRLSSVILWGPPGTGKTTLAQVIARHTAKAYEQLSAVSATVKDVRDTVARAEARLGERGQGTILFLDEVHRFNKAQQDALLPSVESGLLVLVGATTENPYFEVNAPLLSRSTLFRLQPLGPEAIATLLRRGLAAEGAEAEDEALGHLADRVGGDGRHALTCLEVAVALARAREPDAARPVVTLADAEAALGTKLQRYGRDEHYDVVSAFIKSIRG